MSSSDHDIVHLYESKILGIISEEGPGGPLFINFLPQAIDDTVRQKGDAEINAFAFDMAPYSSSVVGLQKARRRRVGQLRWRVGAICGKVMKSVTT